MDYWASIEENRRRGGYYNSGYYNNGNKVSTPTVKERDTEEKNKAKKVVRDADNNVNIVLDPNTTFSLLNLVKFSFPSGLNLNINSPILEGIFSKDSSSSYIDKFVNLVKQSGDLVTITKIQ